MKKTKCQNFEVNTADTSERCINCGKIFKKQSWLVKQCEMPGDRKKKSDNGSNDMSKKGNNDISLNKNRKTARRRQLDETLRDHDAKMDELQRMVAKLQTVTSSFLSHQGITKSPVALSFHKSSLQYPVIPSLRQDFVLLDQ
ncbi:hypothetical protein BBO99_00002778 [Phytophthora kernoviae]|uniref:Uncharacterized protein n=2 Tax=Phytophthora kernoviae TaxID=325452 RepID=A0A3R7JQY8_9STRA|nr:hypothetical protein G195_003688 [Phytophthora kernoviae 00238/432]KAG2528316.1 hypothetical protein JM16_001316 [Phytophthora kernoviae]RLN02081.1 hypothetical protein BBI17_003552 [Phytophthora kernoviae]RLN82630.1 hypothetical protein BBO99_00002778 [Phytophthora kernoviae]